ncbi:manganese-dependent inorganic pyrophosphatase [candidate division WWE3 bacterium]|nr:manganese-dependent inorganic pyrophosphatase [candidate division WWE3 bacterium]
MKIFLLGHKSPDLDAVTGPVIYAEFLEKSGRYKEAKLIPAVCSEINKETKFVFEKFEIDFPLLISSKDIKEDDRIILIDHNEEDQRMEGVDPSKILEIVDHHKIKINFSTPIRIDVRPFGSVSSVIYENFVKEGIAPSKEAACLILASILSDTQGLKSSTTTGWDSKAVEDLARSAGIKTDQLTFEIFKAKSDISGLSPEQIITKDFKIFDFAGKKVFIGQVETVEPNKIYSVKNRIIASIPEIKAKENVGMLFLVITDILKINSHLIYETEEEKRIAEEAFNGIGEDNLIDIGPRMSRKKDIAPEIERVVGLA